MIPLREYQHEGVQRVRARIAAGKRRIVFVLPTGGGKTVVASAIVASALAKGSRVLFVAHRRELIRQTFCKLLRNGIEAQSVGIMMAGVPARAASLFGESPLQILDRMRAAGASDAAIDSELYGLFGARRAQAPIQVASVQTIRGKDLENFDLVIVDECHGARAPSYVSLIQSQWDHAVILGLTATPWPPPGKALGDDVDGRPLFDDMVPPVKTTRELAEMGFLVAPRMFGVPASSLPDMSEANVGPDGDWIKEDLEKASDKDRLIGDIVDHWLRRAGGQRTVVFAAGVNHSKNIAAAFCAAGVRAEHVDGTTDPRTRDAIFSRLDSGETTVVCGCDIFTEGWDQPRVAVLVFARMTRSRRLAKQMMGRGLRPHPEKPFVLFLDHAGVLAEHDSPLAEDDYSIAPSKKKRSSASVSIKTCPACFAIVPGSVRTCPECGHAFSETATREDPEQEDGDLVEIPDASREEKRAAFDALCAQRGSRRPGWVIQQFLERFKVKPPKAWKVPLREDECPENNEAIMTAWRGIFERAEIEGRTPEQARGLFFRELGFWPNRAMLATQRTHITEQDAARVARDAAELRARHEAADRRHAAAVPPPARRRMRVPSFPMEAVSV